jgi:acylaminoacyl-peptidase
VPGIGRTLLLLWAAAAAAREPFTMSDLWTWRTAGDARISPDGQRVVWVEQWNGREQNSAFSNLQSATGGGRDVRALTSGAWRDWQPRWSPDGARLAYLSERGGTVHIRVRRMDSGQEAEAGDAPLSFAWAPDGQWIAFTARVPRKTALDWLPESLLPRVVTGDPAPVEIFVTPAAGGRARQLTHDSFARRGAPAWMPNGQWILNAAERAPDGAAPLEGAEIYAIHVADGAVRRLTEHSGPDEDPLPSPDGSKIAWIRSETRPPAYAIRKLYVMNADGRRARPLTGSLDRDAAAPQWSSDSRTVYFLADDRGATHVYAARNDGTVRQVTNRPERLRGLTLADNGRAATVRTAETDGGSVLTFAVDLPGGVSSVASPNEKLLAERDIGPVEEIRFEAEGRAFQEWLTKPLRTDPARQYPLLLDVRDDPRAMCSAEFDLRGQVLAARGFAVLCANPRGTPGYGEEFGNVLRTRFPGDDFDDLMRGVDAAVARGGIDPKRLMISGGVLAAWALGHTDRFRAAVARHPVADWFGAVALARDGYRRVARTMGALPWEDPDQYAKHSPIAFAQSFKTPTLVIARGPDAQAGELYFALQTRKVDSGLLQFPDDDKPGTAVEELEAMLAWLARW